MRDRHGLLLLRVEIAVKQLKEDPLRPAVVLRIGGVDLAIPVVAEADRLNLPTEVVDVLPGRVGGMLVRLARVFLRGQAERVPAHRVQDVVALHAQMPADDVGGRVTFGMPHVQARAARIREHVEQVCLGLVARFLGVERAVGLVRQPVALPLLFNRREVVGHRASVGRADGMRKGLRKTGPRG